MRLTSNQYIIYSKSSFDKSILCLEYGNLNTFCSALVQSKTSVDKHGITAAKHILNRLVVQNQAPPCQNRTCP